MEDILNDRKRIGLAIAKFRAEKGISQEKLSELSGVGSSHIARIEKGLYSVGIDTLGKIAMVFGKEIDFVSRNQNNYLNFLLEKSNEPKQIMKHTSGIQGVFIKEYKPTGKPMTTMIRACEGLEYCAPSSEFEPINK